MGAPTNRSSGAGIAAETAAPQRPPSMLTTPRARIVERASRLHSCGQSGPAMQPGRLRHNRAFVAQASRLHKCGQSGPELQPRRRGSDPRIRRISHLASSISNRAGGGYDP